MVEKRVDRQLWDEFKASRIIWRAERATREFVIKRAELVQACEKAAESFDRLGAALRHLDRKCGIQLSDLVDNHSGSRARP